MKTGKPNHISFSEIKDVIERLGRERKKFPYIRGDIGILFGDVLNLTDILQTGVPYIMEEPRIALLRKGTAHVIVNMIERDLHADMLVFIGKGTVIQPQSFSPDFEMCGMMIGNERLNLAMSGAVPAELANASPCLAELTPDEAALVHRMFGMIWDLLHQEHLIDSVVNGLLRALLYYYVYINKRNKTSSPVQAPHAQQMFERFIELVNAHCKEHHSLGFYAGKMCITQRYLGTVVRNASGITAKEWIDRAVATSAKVMLRHGSRQIAQISDKLHFPNPSFFCKFFKRMTGMTPQEYRRCDTLAGNVTSR